MGVDDKRAKKIYASVLASGSNRTVDEMDKHITALAAQKASEMAGIGPEDISVAEVHEDVARLLGVPVGKLTATSKPHLSRDFCSEII